MVVNNDLGGYVCLLWSGVSSMSEALEQSYPVR